MRLSNEVSFVVESYVAPVKPIKMICSKLATWYYISTSVGLNAWNLNLYWRFSSKKINKYQCDITTAVGWNGRLWSFFKMETLRVRNIWY